MFTATYTEYIQKKQRLKNRLHLRKERAIIIDGPFKIHFNDFS